MRRRSGFTLVELLAATALFAVLGVLLFQILRGAMDIWSVGERNRELHDRSSAVLELLTEDLRATWAGLPGAGEQDARLLCSYRSEDLDGDGTLDLRVPVLRFSRLCHEARSLGWLRRAGDQAGAEGVATLLATEDPFELRPTGGLAESLYTLAMLPGESSPSLLRRVRAPLGGEDSLLDADLPERPDRLLRDTIRVADQVLWFGLSFWGPATTHWEVPSGEDGVAALDTWDSTRGIVDPDDPSFPYGAGAASLLDGSDDLWPSLVRITLVVEQGQGRAASGVLAEAITADARRLTVRSTTWLRDQDAPDHVLIDGEWMKVTDIDGRVLGVERGARGTRPAVHGGGERVRTGRRFERVVALPTVRENHNG